MTDMERLRELVAKLGSRILWQCHAEWNAERLKFIEAERVWMRHIRKHPDDDEARSFLATEQEFLRQRDDLIEGVLGDWNEARRLIVALRPDLLGLMPSPQAWRETNETADAWERIGQRLLVEPVAPQAPAPPVPTGPAPSINSRMVDTLSREPAAREWTVRQWAKHLGCSTGAVGKQNAWKMLKKTREDARLASARAAGEVEPELRRTTRRK